MTEVGRGAWTRTGGTTPWYEKTPAGTPNVGEVYWRVSHGQQATDPNYAGHPQAFKAVNYGVQALQKLLGLTGTAVDGWLGTDTATAIKAVQGSLGLVADAQAGPRTLAALLRPLIVRETNRIVVPFYVLNGLINWESGADVAAIGVNGWDTGVAQINLDPVGGWGNSITFEQAMDPGFSINWAANELSGARTRLKPYCDKSGANLTYVMIANHNSPALALQWAKTGVPPYVVGRVIQIDQYVARVLASG